MKITRSHLFCALIIIFFAGFSGVSTMAVEGGQIATLTIEPVEGRLMPGDQGEFSVWVKGVRDLYGAELKVHYDPALLAIVDHDPTQEGAQVMLTEMFRDGFIAVNQVDQENGIINFAATRINPAPPFEGDGELFRISVIAQALGTTDLFIKDAILANREGMSLEFESKKATLKIGEEGSENTFALAENQTNQKQEEERRTNEEKIQPIFLIAAVGGFLLLITAFFYVIRISRRRER